MVLFYSLSDVLNGLTFIHDTTIQSFHEVGFNFPVLGTKITDDVLVEPFRLLTHGKGDLGIAEMIVQQPADQTRCIDFFVANSTPSRPPRTSPYLWSETLS